MAITSARLTVSTVAIPLNAATPTGQQLTINNTSANPADLGASTVAAGTGYALAGGASVVLDLGAG
jgi:hypothetical protein